MSLEKDLEDDISQFFRETDRMLLEDKKKHLKTLFDKYCHLSSSTVLLDKYDLDMIKSLAIRDIVDKVARVYMGKNRREVSSSDINTLRIVEATIGLLNNKDCFKKKPKFDYRNE